MRHDTRPVGEQVKSGFIIVAKILAAFGIAVTFLSGSTLIRSLPRTWNHFTLGWLIVALSIAAMFTTVRFWAAGFCGFVGYGAFRSLGGILVAGAYHVPRLYMAALSASIFLMFLLSIRFTSKKWQITPVDRISAVIAASSMLVALLMGNTYEGVLVFNAGNVALLLSWFAARTAKHHRHSRHTEVPA
jgi:hypothetical protein